MYSIVFKCLGYSPNLKGNISPSTFDEQLSNLQPHVLAISTQLMVFCSPFQVVSSKCTQGRMRTN